MNDYIDAPEPCKKYKRDTEYATDWAAMKRRDPRSAPKMCVCGWGKDDHGDIPEGGAK